MDEPAILIEHRAELHYLLTEAAEIEHGLMCCYLYAAFSLKDGEADGLSPEEAAAVRRMRETVLDIARDEMVHLALVWNLMTATGAGPHLQRQNFPVSPGYHPAGVVVSLAPLDRATLDHFLFLERPEGVDLPDGEGFQSSRSYQRIHTSGRLVPTAQDYATVGHLYRGIRAGIEQLVAIWGEARVFNGDPRLQVGADVLAMDGLDAITDLPSALRALDTIVTQGEGAPGHHERAHYSRYRALHDELVALTAKNPSFAPAHPAPRNPVMRRPVDPEGRVWITREPAASLLDLGNAVYAFMLRALGGLFGHPITDATVRGALVDGAIDAMHSLSMIGSYLPRLPATDDDAGPRAGLTFTMSRMPEAFPDARRGLRMLAESARAISRTLERVAIPVDPRFGRARDLIAKAGMRFDELAATAPAGTAPGPIAPAATAPAAPPTTPEVAAQSIVDGVEIVRGEGIELRFEAARCIHSRHCVLETPEVFLANVKGPWIHPDRAPIDRVVHVARTCPSGAITYQRLDGGADEDVPPVNLIRVRERGPLAFQADLHITGHAPRLRATLCRCGASQHKPYCDGSHTAAGFDATGEPATTPTEPLAARGGPLTVDPQTDGPLRVRGPMEVVSGTGRTVHRLVQANLCRCGGSSNKPFCDGTHAKNGFKAP
ncbi:MAG: ferritin-like domain-containing protein [Polyangiaceae bacterium]